MISISVEVNRFGHPIDTAPTNRRHRIPASNNPGGIEESDLVNEPAFKERGRKFAPAFDNQARDPPLAELVECKLKIYLSVVNSNLHDLNRWHWQFSGVRVFAEDKHRVLSIRRSNELRISWSPKFAIEYHAQERPMSWKTCSIGHQRIIGKNRIYSDSDRIIFVTQRL